MQRVRHFCNSALAPRVWAMGNGLHGSLGTPMQTIYPEPTELEPMQTIPEQLAAGVVHSGALLQDGTISTWGESFYSQVGYREDNSGFLSILDDEYPTPGVLTKLMDHTALQLEMGCFHTAMLTDVGEVYCWGGNGSGQLGVGSNINDGVAQKVELGNALIIQIACGGFHTLAVDDDGVLFGWGKSHLGQFGPHVQLDENMVKPSRMLNDADILLPARVLSYEDIASKHSLGKVDSIAGGLVHSAVLSESGEVVVMGGEHFDFEHNPYTLFDPDPSNLHTPDIRVLDLKKRRVKHIVCGTGATAGIFEDGVVFVVPNVRTMDVNHLEAFGDAVLLDIPGNVISVSLGGRHLAAVTEEGELWTLGDGQAGQLGHGDLEPQVVPKRVAPLSGLRHVACGWDYTLVL